jgi:hypothetical protein
MQPPPPIIGATVFNEDTDADGVTAPRCSGRARGGGETVARPSG